MSEAYRLLEIEAAKSRVSQNMPSEVIDQLTSKLTIEQQQSLTRHVIRLKNINHRTTQDCYVIMKCCTSFQYFQDILRSKGDKALQEVCKHLYYSEFDSERTIYSIGDVADKFYVISLGEVAVVVPQKRLEKQPNGEEKLVEVKVEAARLHMGDVFGETSAKEKSRRAVNTLTMTKCELFEIKKKDFDSIVKFLIVSEFRARYMFLEDIELFSSLDKTSFESILYNIREKDVNIGNVLFREGDEVDNIYIVKSGEFRLEKSLVKEDSCSSLQRLRFVQPNRQRCNIYVVGCREVLGDVEICNNATRQHTCTCITEHAKLFVLDRGDFQAKVMDDVNNNHMRISEYIFSKSLHLNRRISDFRRLSNLMERKQITLDIPQKTFVFARSEKMEKANFDHNILQRIVNRQYDGDIDSFHTRSPLRKRSIRSQKLIVEGRTNSTHPKRNHMRRYSNIPFAVKMVSDIVQQEKRYNDLRGARITNAFQLNPKLPTYFIVKMNIRNSNSNARCKTEGKAESPQRASPSTQLSRTIKTAQKDAYRKRKIRTTSTSNEVTKLEEYRNRANPRTPYGKHFESLLYS